MNILYALDMPTLWIVSLIVQIIGYFFILKKMDLKRWTAIIPFLAEQQFTTKLYRRRRTFYRPFILALIFVLGALYLDPAVGMGRVFIMVAILIYGLFQIRLYWRLAKAFDKSKAFAIGLILIPPIFLLKLGLGKAAYRPLELKPLKEYSRPVQMVRRVCLVVISVAEICAIVACVAFIAVRDTPPAPLVNMILNENYEATKDVTGTGDVVEPAKSGDIKASREYFFPTHKKDQNVVVMTYVIGSNLEDKSGLATANINQMVDATKKGSGLTFVLEAGGSERWFTSGITDSSYGRYTIQDGKLNKVKKLPASTCMTEKKSLVDFLTWAKKQYPADRYMLVLWDHGGGVAYGYGQDDLNDRKTGSTMRVSEIASAIEQTGLRFDMIGFDACLMQDIEIASALEPYADYYLASEEVEGGYGWFYTSGFGKLAEDPGLDTKLFGREMVACYDPYNTIIKDEDGKPDRNATLSFVDLTKVQPAYKKLTHVLASARQAVQEDPSNYANMAVAASNAYNFTENMQIDLIDYIKILDKLDYNDEICSHKEKKELLNALRACILYRNGNSAKGVNGMAFAFPFQAIEHYSTTSDELKRLSLKSEKKLFDDIFSIMAAQQKKDMEKKEKESDSFFDSLMAELEYTDYTEESWYVKGFEDYDNTKALIDIPLKELADGFQIQLPKKAWNIIADCQTMVYQETQGEVKGASQRFLGTDHIGSEDPNGNPMIGMDDNWVHINGELVCYEAKPVKSTDEGEIYTGTVKARLNDEDDIVLNVEWEPSDSEEDISMVGSVTGYEADDQWDFMDFKGERNLQAGDTIQFLFDYYDKEGNLIKTKPAGGKIRVTKQSRLEVKDSPIGTCDIQFGGMLTDVYNRILTTEQIEMHID